MNTLENWQHFATDQAGRLGAPSVAPIWRGGPTDVINYVQGESVLESVCLERAIRHFARTLQWPPLTPAQKFFLVRRLALGAEAIAEWRRARKLKQTTTLPKPPDPNRREEFVEWLLVSVWQIRGELHLAAWIDESRRNLSLRLP